MIAGAIGLMSGSYEGVKISSARFLTENSHRLPKNVGGWYFYHKKKNYVMISNGFRTGAKQGIKYSFLVSLFFGAEALVDKVRGQIDFLNTTVTSGAFFTAFGYYKKLSSRQRLNYGKRGLLFGLSMGFCQDVMIWIRGGHIWYFDHLGVPNRYEAQGQTLGM